MMNKNAVQLVHDSQLVEGAFNVPDFSAAPITWQLVAAEPAADRGFCVVA